MKWIRCALLQTTYTEDILNNQVPSGHVPVTCTRCRMTPWTASDVQLLGRDVTETEQAVIVPLSLSCFPAGVTHIRIDGQDLEITEMSDLGRWTMLRIKKYRTRK